MSEMKWNKEKKYLNIHRNSDLTLCKKVLYVAPSRPSRATYLKKSQVAHVLATW